MLYTPEVEGNPDQQMNLVFFLDVPTSSRCSNH